MRRASLVLAGLVVLGLAPYGRGESLLERAGSPDIRLAEIETGEPVTPEMLGKAIVLRIPKEGPLVAVRLPGLESEPVADQSALRTVFSLEGRRVGPWNPDRRSLPAQTSDLQVLLWVDRDATWRRLRDVLDAGEWSLPRARSLWFVGRNPTGDLILLPTKLPGCHHCSSSLPPRPTSERVLGDAQGRLTEQEARFLDRYLPAVARRRSGLHLAVAPNLPLAGLLSFLERARRAGLVSTLCAPDQERILSYSFSVGAPRDRAPGQARHAHRDDAPPLLLALPLTLWLGDPDRVPRRESEEALANRWLFAHLTPPGTWDRDGTAIFDPPGSRGAGDVAATSLAVLTLLGRGETRRVGRHRKLVRGGLRFLVSGQDDEGRLSSRGAPDLHRRHALATLALVEAAPKLPATGAALAFLVRERESVRDPETRAWMHLAFESARAAGLEAPSSEGLDEALRAFTAPQNMDQWFLATLGAFRGGRETWAPWLERVRRELLARQHATGRSWGSWDPMEPGRRGRVEATALGALCAQIVYRYPDTVGVR